MMGKENKSPVAQFVCAVVAASPELAQPTKEMFDMEFSPPRRPKRVAFAAKQLQFNDDDLSAAHRKHERLEELAERTTKKANECLSPAPWRLLPKRESLTPRDAESRDAARHVAALRLQTLLHHKRAQRAFAKTVKLEKAERERRKRSSSEASSGESILEKRVADLEAEKELEASEHAQQLRDMEASVEERAAALTAAAEDRALRAEAEASEARDALSLANAHFQADRDSWDAVRRSLHNRVVELQGNIRTFVRVRPPLDVANSGVDTAVTLCCPRPAAGASAESIVVPETVAPGGPPRKPRHFNFAFDRVLDQNADQAAVFEAVKPFVQSALDGYKVCVFAYGQTGSGKTYTTLGAPDAPGILGRALDLVFDAAKRRADTVAVEMFEIYLDKVYDLLGDAPTKPLDVRGTDSLVLPDLARLEAASPDVAARWIDKAQARRKVGATKSNATSSRSHCVVTLRVGDGVLNLVDLAGSERLAVSGSNEDKQLLREAQAINSSLAALGNVIAALAKSNSNHVPYRDSKLTHILAPYLGTDAKALAIFAVAPELVHERETLSSLRFAQKVRLTPCCVVSLPSRRSPSASPTSFYVPSAGSASRARRPRKKDPTGSAWLPRSFPHSRIGVKF